MVDCRAAACVDVAVLPPHSLLLFSLLQQQHQLSLIHLQLSRTIPQLCSSRWVGSRRKGARERLERLVAKLCQLYYHSHFAINKATQAAIREKLHATILQNGRKRKKIKLQN